MGHGEKTGHAAVLAAVHEYRRRGWSPTPLDGKNPSVGGTGWQTREHTDEEFAPGLNVGVILANGLVDVDLDAPEARHAAPYTLPATKAVFGRPSSPRSHWFYQTREVLDTRQFVDPVASANDGTERMLVEYRSGNRSHQTMMPPSLHHESGERVEWVEHGEPAVVESSTLLRGVKMLAAAAHLGRYWPRGQRHSATLALAGGLANSGWEEGDVIRFVRAVCAAAQDEESADRVRAVKDTFAKVALSRSATGWPSLRKIFGGQIVDRISEWLGLNHQEVQVSLNNSPREREIVTQSEKPIRWLADIPNIQVVEFPPVDYLVPGLVARGTITVWAGPCGSGKSYLGMKLAVAVATGSEFLGRRCQKAPVLYLDYENPDFAIRDRLALMADGPLNDLHVWGSWSWLKQEPPQIGSELLLTIAKKERPLFIFDTLRYAHHAEENDSTAMAGIMQQLKFCAAAGCAVVLMHHPGKTEGSQSRGSSVIRDHADVCLLHEYSAETGLISLCYNKNRISGEAATITIRPNFEEGTFEVCDSPEFTKRTEDSHRLLELIAVAPGMSQNAIYKKFGGKKERLRGLLGEYDGSLWRSERRGPSICYFPVVPSRGNNPGNKGTSDGSEACSPVPSLFRGNRGTTHPDGKVVSTEQGSRSKVEERVSGDV